MMILSVMVMKRMWKMKVIIKVALIMFDDDDDDDQMMMMNR